MSQTFDKAAIKTKLLRLKREATAVRTSSPARTHALKLAREGLAIVGTDPASALTSARAADPHLSTAKMHEAAHGPKSSTVKHR